MDDKYPPYAFRDGGGRLQGILVDRWRLWEERTGIRAEIHAMDWQEALRRFQAGEFDVIDTIFRNGPRERLFAFSKPYARVEVPVFFQKNVSGITDASSLKEFPVAVKNGDAAVDFLLRRGVNRLVGYDSYEEILRAAQEHKVGVFVMDKPPAMYFLYKMGIQKQFQLSKPLYIGRVPSGGPQGERTAPRDGGGGLRPALPAGIGRDRPELARRGDGPGTLLRPLFLADPRRPGADPRPDGMEPRPPEVGGAKDDRSQEGDDRSPRRRRTGCGLPRRTTGWSSRTQGSASSSPGTAASSSRTRDCPASSGFLRRSWRGGASRISSTRRTGNGSSGIT